MTHRAAARAGFPSVLGHTGRLREGTRACRSGQIVFYGETSGGGRAAAGSPFKEHQMSRAKRMWREVEGAVEVTALAAVECALLIVILAVLGLPHAAAH
ncbi:hypothetical protein WS62_26565 [Burkholderia sp. ABCPW 14]|uniref:hypothetical protein n=1 Tax=Burkholderia sp. ABCPW 14 TaxID=1637860 RepID=UPI000770DA13|nr:hypothetical protein [Burkholderia sp. ABCPW 14]KVD80617.1 hypothetical protein WS62_26565 [Burkholderia sp. ABCPW 14]